MYKYVLTVFLVSSLFTQTTGKISGTVSDTDNNALIGANVIIENSGIGTSTGPDGTYFIINIAPGTYTLRFDIIGYTSVHVEEVRVSVNKTTRIDAQLKESAVEGDVVFVKASKISTN